MNRLLLSLLIIVYSNAISFSQNCNPATVAQLPGSWKAGMKNPAGSADAATIAKAKKNMDAFHNSIRSKYSPVGLQVSYSFSSVSKNRDLGMFTYGYSHIILPFYCDKNVVKQAHEGNSGLILNVNPGYFFVGGGSGYMAEQDHLVYGYIDRMPAQKDGIWDLGEIDYIGGFSRQLKKLIYLVTYENQLPFQYVSRLEFLQKKKAGVQKEKQEAITSTKERIPIRPKAVQDKEKEDALIKIKDKAAKGHDYDWSAQFLRNYQTDEQKQEDAVRKTSEYYDKQLRLIDEHLRLPEKDLQQPAIVFSYQEFRGFLKEGEAGASILVKENKAYYDRKLPKNASQLFFVQFIYDHNDPVSSKAFKDVQKAIDFTLLKNMIGK